VDGVDGEAKTLLGFSLGFLVLLFFFVVVVVVVVECTPTFSSCNHMHHHKRNRKEQSVPSHVMRSYVNVEIVE
jgi:hypothetical protein